MTLTNFHETARGNAIKWDLIDGKLERASIRMVELKQDENPQ